MRSTGVRLQFGRDLQLLLSPWAGGHGTPVHRPPRPRGGGQGLDDRDLWDAIEAGGFGDGNLHAFRAALLNILLNK